MGKVLKTNFKNLIHYELNIRTWVTFCPFKWMSKMPFFWLREKKMMKIFRKLPYFLFVECVGSIIVVIMESKIGSLCSHYVWICLCSLIPTRKAGINFFFCCVLNRKNSLALDVNQLRRSRVQNSLVHTYHKAQEGHSFHWSLVWPFPATDPSLSWILPCQWILEVLYKFIITFL